MSTSRFNIRGLRDRDELTAFGKELGEEIKSDDVPSMAAAVAFKIVLALFPALLAGIAIFGLVTKPSELQGLLDSLGAVAPSGVVEFLREPLDRLIRQEGTAGGVAIAGIAGGLWAASGAAATLDKSLTRAYDETEGRKLPAQRGVALLVTVALLLALILIFVLLVTGGALEDRFIASLPLTETAGGVVDFFATLGRFAASLIALMILFAFIYWVGPDFDERPSWAWITPGAFIGVVTWLVASGLFGLYTGSRFASYSESGSVYGPLGNAILFMLWLQLSMFALLLGAEVNQVLQLRARRLAASDGATGQAGSGQTATPSSAVQGAPTTRTATARAGAHRQLSDDDPDDPDDADDPDSDADTTATGARHSADPGRAVAVHEHRGASGDIPARGSRSVTARDRRPAATDDQRIPVPTMVGAAVAAVSSVVGLAGLLRRLKGE